MQINPEELVRNLALQVPGAVRVFQKYHIDFCCGGNRVLREACGLAGASYDDVLGELKKEGNRDELNDQKWTEMPIMKLVQHILDHHHKYTRDAIDTIQPLCDKVVRVHGDNHTELKRVGEIFAALRMDLEPHLMKEEQILFPAIEDQQEGTPSSHCFGSIRNPIAVMHIEHDTVGKLLKELRALTSNYAPPQDACTSYRALYRELEALESDIHMHIHLENNVLFPRVLSDGQAS